MRQVLIISNSLTLRMDLREAFEAEGYIVAQCDGAAAVRALLERRDWSLVLLDDLVIEAAGEALRSAFQDLAGIPALLLAGSPDTTLPDGRRPDLVIPKPYDRDDVTGQASALLERASARPTGTMRAEAPRSSAPPGQTLELSPTTSPSPDAAVTPPRLLVVDDSLTYRSALAEQLRAELYDVDPVGSGEEALARLVTERYDAILLDLLMPGLSGRETCQRIKANPAWREIPLIVLTAREDAVVDALSMGADDFVMKSASPDVLIVRTRAHLRRRHYERENARIQAELYRSELEVAEVRQAKELAETRAALLADLEEKNVELARMQQLREELSAHIVHDLKNPLSVITLGARLLRKERDLSVTGRQVVQRIVYAGDTMHRMIMNLLDINRKEANALALQLEPVETGALLGEVGEQMRPRAQDRRLALDFQVEPGCPPIYVDREMVRRVLENLVDNAIKFSERDSGILLTAHPSQAGFVEVQVRDEGPGIPEDQRQRLFEPYVQLEHDDDTRRLGRGLGLAFCRMAVEAHGGRIWVEENAPSGARFCFTVPSRQDDSERRST